MIRAQLARAQLAEVRARLEAGTGHAEESKSGEDSEREMEDGGCALSNCDFAGSSDF